MDRNIVKENKLDMEEKILIERTADKKSVMIINIICLCCAIIVFIIAMYEMGYYITADEFLFWVCGPTFVPIILWLILVGWLAGGKLVVTDKRIYGKVAYGKRVDLPLDSISAVGLTIFNSLSVSTSSGRIIFHLVPQRDEVHKIISDLIIDRQNSKQNNVIVKGNNSNADELKKYKELLDSGIITNEEYEAKKKQLLGL